MSGGSVSGAAATLPAGRGFQGAYPTPTRSNDVKPFLMSMAAFLALVLVADAAFAGPGQHRRGRQLSPEMRQKILEEFDANADGKLDEGEREAARTALRERFEQRKQEMLRTFDADGDGKLGETERKAAREAHRQQRQARWFKAVDANEDGLLSPEELEAWRAQRRAKAVERFDANDDGQLDGAERRRAMRQMRGMRGRHGGRGMMRGLRHRGAAGETRTLPAD